MSRKNKALFFILTLLVIYKGFFHIHNTKTLFNEKIATQERRNTDVKRFKKAYRALLPVKERWLKTFRPVSDRQDYLDLHQMIGIEKYPDVYTDSEILQQEPVEKHPLIDLGLEKIQVRSHGYPGFLIVGKSVNALMNCFIHLSERKDIQMGAVMLFSKENKPMAVIQGFYILLRTSGDENEHH